MGVENGGEWGWLRMACIKAPVVRQGGTISDDLPNIHFLSLSLLFSLFLLSFQPW